VRTTPEPFGPTPVGSTNRWLHVRGTEVAGPLLTGYLLRSTAKPRRHPAVRPCSLTAGKKSQYHGVAEHRVGHVVAVILPGPP
jgi:hypothetical protein